MIDALLITFARYATIHCTLSINSILWLVKT